MRVYSFCFILWIGAIWLETFVLPSLPYFQPNIFFLIPLMLTFRWKGPECWFISAFFGFTADSFASTPVGLYAMSYFILSFFTRWIAVKFFQETPFFLVGLCGILSFGVSFLAHFFLFLLEGKAFWAILFKQGLFFQVLPTAALIVPGYYLLLQMEKKFKITLSQRKF